MPLPTHWPQSPSKSKRTFKDPAAPSVCLAASGLWPSTAVIIVTKNPYLDVSRVYGQRSVFESPAISQKGIKRYLKVYKRLLPLRSRRSEKLCVCPAPLLILRC